MTILIAVTAVLGLAIGSFLNVVVHRVPRGESLLSPGSHCPACAAPVRARHNIPVLGWMMLRGRCADCAAPISVRYPAVELITGALFAATTAELAHRGLLAALPAYLFFVAAGIALAAIDLSTLRLPNAIVYPSYFVLAALLTVAALVDADAAALLRALVGAAGLAVGFFALALAKPGGMGMGDVKLAGVIGGVLGYLSYSALIVGTFLAFTLGALAGLALILGRRADRKTLLPFGPAMVGGALVALFANAPLIDFYHSLSPHA